MTIYNSAIQFVAERGICTTGALQRRFNIGYNQALELIEKLEADHVVSAPNSRGIREVLIAPDETEQYLISA